jgi:hypothetical protein
VLGAGTGFGGSLRGGSFTGAPGVACGVGDGGVSLTVLKRE